MASIGHVFKRIGHYLDPRTHIKQLERAARFHERVVEDAAHFAAREARKEYVGASKVFAVAAKIVTPILAAVASFIPILGIVLGPILAGLGALIQRFSSAVALRAKGIKGLRNRQLSRSAERRTFKYGLVGAAIGSFVSGILAIVGVGASAGVAASEAGATGAVQAGSESAATAAAASAAPAVETAGEATAVGGASAAAGTAPAVGEFASAGPYALGTEVATVQTANTAAEISNVAAAGVRGALAQPGLAEAAGAGSGILGTGITWKQVGAAITAALPFLKNLFGPQAGGQNSLARGPGAGSGGDGSGGDTSGGGDLLDTLSGLPLWLKLGAGVVGAGALALGLRKKKEKAA